MDEPRPVPSGRILKRAMPALLIAVLLLGAVFVWLNLPHWLTTPDTLRRVDAIVVPAGDPDVRVARAVKLLDKGLAREVWVVPSSSGDVLNEPKAIADYARERRHGDDVVVLKKKSRNIVRDAHLTAARLRNRGRGFDIAVVTSPIEIARTRMVFERATGREVRVWRDGERYERRWQSLVGESTLVVKTLALLGAGRELRGGDVPSKLPLKAAGGGFVVALLVGWVCRPLARRLGMVSIPRLWRAHATPTPMLGGIALLAGLAGGIFAAGGVRLGAVGAAAGAGVLVIALVGLVDDIAGLGAGVRIVWATCAGTAAWLLGLRAVVLPSGRAGADFFNAVMTILWFVAVNVAVNWLDNLDGVTGGVGAASAAAITLAAALGGQFVVSVVAAALCGACIGYLVHNFAPARLFMGDMGASGLGFALAALALALRSGPRPPLSITVAVLMIAIPIFDMVLVTVSRLGAGQSPAVGGTDHTSHRLLARGMSVRTSAAFLWGAQAVLGAAAVAISRSPSGLGWTIVAAVTAGGIGALMYFLRVQPWKPPWQLEATEQVVQAVHRAMRALRGLEEAVGDEAWRLSDPRAARSTQETLRRLERVRRLLEARPPGPGGPDEATPG